MFDRAGKGIGIEYVNDATALLLCGEPINEPIVGQSPFVINTTQEIRQAMDDYRSENVALGVGDRAGKRQSYRMP